MSDSKNSINFNWKPFVYGGIASMAAEIVTFPIDTTKTRLQLQGQTVSTGSTSVGVSGPAHQPPRYRGMLHAAVTIAKTEGPQRLYRGIKPALLRQATYGTIKIGLYQSFKRMVVEDPKDETMAVNMLCGVLAGAISSSMATPTDVLKIRMQAHSEKPRYTGVIQAFGTIYKEEGLKGLWRGVIPTAQRASIITCVELPAYDQVKRWILKHQYMNDNIYAHFTSSFIAGFAGSLASNPIDVVKTRLMNQSVTATPSEIVYKGAIDCIAKTIRNEGFMALYKGFLPNFIRLGPWNIVFFLTYEQLKKLN